MLSNVLITSWDSKMATGSEHKSTSVTTKGMCIIAVSWYHVIIVNEYSAYSVNSSEYSIKFTN